MHDDTLTSAARTKARVAFGSSQRRSGVFTISLDFELYWGMRHRADVHAYRDNLIGARRAIPEILALFTKYEIHATWAVVGFLFFERTRALLDGAPAILPTYADPALAVYQDLPDEEASDGPDSVYFAPSLIKLIAETPHQEIATHSFSHYSCLEAGHSLPSFREDLKAAKRAIEASYPSPSSLVFPKNQVNHECLSTAAELGITAYRGTSSHWLYRATADREQGSFRRLCRLLDSYVPLSGSNCSQIPQAAPSSLPVNVPASRYLRPYSPLLKLGEPLRLRRIKGDMWKAAERNRLFHLWWHPHDFGLNLDKNLECLEHILTCFDVLRQIHGMDSMNMRELAQRTTC